jgi:hypothetical protein
VRIVSFTTISYIHEDRECGADDIEAFHAKHSHLRSPLQADQTYVKVIL